METDVAAQEVVGVVRRVLATQEERQLQYGRLVTAQQQYSSGQWSLQQYQVEMSAVTVAFSSLSQAVVRAAGWFREKGRSEVTSLLEEVQQLEKEKLQLTVKFQVQKQEHKTDKKEEAEEEVKKEEEEEGGGGGYLSSVEEERRMRKRLAELETAIAGLVRDLRLECETELMAAAGQL